jgi:hypothetical protein
VHYRQVEGDFMSAVWHGVSDGFSRAPRLDPLRSALAKLDPSTAP